MGEPRLASGASAGQSQPSQVAIFSPVPPPFGGVSVHVSRLLDHLRASSFPVRVHDCTGKSIPERGVVAASKSLWGYLRFLLTVPEPVVHFHTNSPLAMLPALAVLRLRQRKVVFSLHSEKPMRRLKACPAPLRYLFLRLLRRASGIICVNANLYQWLIDGGIPAANLRVLPAFIPPSADECDSRHLGAELAAFLAGHEQVIGSQGWWGYFLKGIHVYSFDMLGEMLRHLRQDRPGLGLVTAISGCYDSQHRQDILALRDRLGLRDHWLLLEQPFPAVSLYAKCRAFVRPTITDGDSVSLRECLMLGVPVVASDAVTRPPGTILFSSRDQEAFNLRVAEALALPPVAATAFSDPSAKQELPDGVAQILALYQQILRA